MQWARLVVAVVLLGGCSGGRGADDDTLPPTVSTSTTADYSVPATIDVAYVEKVMGALDHVYGDAIRILARERTITKEFLEHLVAIYTEQEFETAQRAWVADVAAGLPGMRDRPGDPTTAIEKAVTLERDCMVVAVKRDFSGSRASQTSTPQKYIALVPRETSRDPRKLNRTPWAIAFDGFVATPAGAPPESPCDT